MTASGLIGLSLLVSPKIRNGLACTNVLTQYLAIRYAERLSDEQAVTSVGSKGDSYDNALAETVNGLYKTELIYRRGPWKSMEQLELATGAWVNWWNEQRLHEACQYVPPAEFEENHYRRLGEPSSAA